MNWTKSRSILSLVSVASVTILGSASQAECVMRDAVVGQLSI